MEVDYLIIGQGICGTFLGHYLQENNCSFLIINESKNDTASKVASGVINPITGRRLVRTWMIEEVLPFAVNTYQNIESKLNINCIEKLDIIDFFATPQMKIAFEERLLQEKDYLSKLQNETQFDSFFNNVFGAGVITNCWLIDLHNLLNNYRNAFIEKQQIVNDYFNIDELKVSEDFVEYKNIKAKKIIFCDGVANTLNKYFNILPYAPNKGEVLIVRIPDLPRKSMYKYGISIIPWKDDLFWVGSTYEWKFDDDKPTQQFRNKTEQTLQQILKIPFQVVEHLCAVRPANIERRPFVGFHPIYKNVGLLNGMGTKGCSLAPYFANELVNHLLNKTPINPLADINRFDRILSKK